MKLAAYSVAPPPAMVCSAGYGSDAGGPADTEAVLLALGQAVELRDHTTSGHCERLSFFSLALGMAMRLDRLELLALYRGGYLHDIGKVALPDAVLFKPGRLNEEEWATMRAHPLIGETICRRLHSLAPVLPIIRSHHERWDGSGYPDKVRGSEIPLLARVLQLADIYDALTSVRPYKRAYSPAEALTIMEQETARGWRDPELMEAFLRMHRGINETLAECGSAVCSDLASMESSLLQLEAHLNRDTAPGVHRAVPAVAEPGRPAS